MRLHEQSYRQTLILDKDRQHPAHDYLVNLLSKRKNLLKVIDTLFYETRKSRQDAVIEKVDVWVQDVPDLPLDDVWTFGQPKISHAIGPRRERWFRGERYTAWDDPLLYPAGYLDLYIEKMYLAELRIVYGKYSLYPRQLDARYRTKVAECRGDLPGLEGANYPGGLRTVYHYDHRAGPPMIEFDKLPAEVGCEPVGFRWQTCCDEEMQVAFEVKVEINSAAEVIQQINCYRTYLRPNTSFVVVSPDDRYRDIIESQDISFYKPSPEVIARLGLS
jgi:hypothetical protein